MSAQMRSKMSARRLALGSLARVRCTPTATAAAATPSPSTIPKPVTRILASRVDRDHPAGLEDPGDGAVVGHVAAATRERGANVGDRAVPVVSDRVDDDGGAAGSVALVGDFLEIFDLAGAGATVDGTFDVVAGHVVIAGVLDGQT